MGFEEKYEHWRRTRAQVEVPGAFADRVMASIHRTRQRTWWAAVYGVALAVGRSRIARAAAASLAVVVCLLRIGSTLAIFIPR